MTAALPTRQAARQLLLDHIDRLPDEEIIGWALDLMYPEEEDEELTEEDFDPNNPLVFTEEESRARIEASLEDVGKGKRMPLAEFDAWMEERKAARAQR